MKFYRKLFFPFVPVYYSVTWFRNKLYDLGVKKSVSFDFPVICVGNLSVGGTGKTPMIQYLIELLKEDYSIATLSRGYKRKTKDFQLADLNATSETIGDEPFQFFSKFKDKIQVAVDSDRVNGINKLKSLNQSPEIILLDDAFQHRKVKAGLNILLTTYYALFVDDYVLPVGNLRESRNGYKRANIIVITKCPKDLDETEKNTIIKRLNPLDYQKVFFSNIEYSSFVKSNENEKNLVELNEFTLVTGIANAQPLVDFLKDKKLKFEHLNFQDHYDFSESDIDELCKKDLILTTEKDFMRLQSFPSLKDKLFYLPITVSISESDKFNSLVKKFVTSKM